ncbi:hypothetical protein AB0I84_25425 [Streptomyces spectabilis]|uniref:hypothetical protein n=1 Tax=Streptomyces spectabilis TaxID=68270 RepID=UPI0033E1201F
MTSGTPPIKIHFWDPDENDDEEVALTDVGVANLNGERHLFLSPQSFYSAVRQVKSAMPDLPEEQVERLVREHCEFKDFDELLGAPVEVAPPVDLPPPVQEPDVLVPPRGGRAKKWGIAAALLPALAGSWMLGHYTGAGPAPAAASAPAASPDAASDEVARDNRNLGPEPFTAHDFKDFSEAGKIHCSPIDNLEAECTDSDGMVMATKAATGPDSTIFTFSYGRERIGLRIFGTADYAETWTLQEGSQELYPNMTRSGRYVLWSTDAARPRLKEYTKLLASASKKSAAGAHQVSMMGAADPLPPRLAALTLGTLGLDRHDVHTILFDSRDAAAVDAPVLMAARAILGVGDGRSAVMQPGEEDIVALAMGLEPSPVVAEPDAPVSGESGGSAVVVTNPGPAPGPKPTEIEQTQKPGEPRRPVEPRRPKEPTVPEPRPKPEEPKPEEPKPEEPKPEEPKPEEPTVEPEHPPTSPEAPGTIPSAELPTVPQGPGPGETQPSAGSVAEEPSVAEQPPGADSDGELLGLSQAWVAPTA